MKRNQGYEEWLDAHMVVTEEDVNAMAMAEESYTANVCPDGDDCGLAHGNDWCPTCGGRLLPQVPGELGRRVEYPKGK